MAAVKLLIISSDCNPKSELSFSRKLTNWKGIVDALTLAQYHFAMRRLPWPCPSAPEVVFLTLLAGKKVAFLYDSGDHYCNTDTYQITYDQDRLMNSLPSHVDLKGLPRFHLFESLPEQLQWAIVQRIDHRDYLRLRTLSHKMRKIQYSHPVSKPKKSSTGTAPPKISSREKNRFLGIASRVCVWAVLLLIVVFEE